MRVFHAADIHLDSPLRGLALYEDAPVDQLRSATRRAFDNLIEAAIDEHVDLLLLAGDVFDGDWMHYGSGAHFVRQMLRLRDAGIHVVSVSGNHDAQSRITRSLRLPDNVVVLDARRAQTWRDEELGVAVHGQGYAEPAVVVDLCAGYPAALPGLVNIGLLHTSADGRPGHERYAPCSVETLIGRGYDYFALGHVHDREVVCAEPPVVFSGVLQGRGLRECGPKGATLVAFEDGAVEHRHRVLDVVRWEVVEVDAAGCSDRDEACERVVSAVRGAVRDAEGRLLACRVRFTGRADAHGRLLADAERLRHDVALAAAEAAGDEVGVQGVDVRTERAGPRAAAGDDAVGELVAELDALAGDDASMASLGKLLEPLAGALPVSVLDEFNPADPDVLRTLVEEVRETLPLALTRAED